MNKNDYKEKLSIINDKTINTSGSYGNKGYTFQKTFLLYELLNLKDYNVYAFYELVDDILFLFAKNNEIYSTTICQVKGKYVGTNNTENLNNYYDVINSIKKRINLVQDINNEIDVFGKFIFSGKLHLNSKYFDSGEVYSKILGYEQLSLIESNNINSRIVIHYFDHPNSEHLNILRQFIKDNDTYKIFSPEQIEDVISQLIGIIDLNNDSLKLESKFLSDVSSRKWVKYSNVIDAMKKFSSLNSYSEKIMSYIQNNYLKSFNFPDSVGLQLIRDLRKYEIDFKWGNNTIYDKLVTKIKTQELTNDIEIYEFLSENKISLNNEQIAWLLLEGKIILEANYEQNKN
ncbi:hypothetical protein [Spiroplasma sp. SV19]|uniref:hypothetical protein n=1 Tax=Spiroplasma sp. SV19 TaxID=2570468 RepID=UPI0024B67BD6|nr:hypothetical protein [Spiroplasma sp. SV19]WHQ37083.1 hypothetical protein E7Y35_04195 [Spiroplasma sp. SV19]